MLNGPKGDIHDTQTPIEDLKKFDSPVLLSSTPQTLSVSKKTLVVAFHLSGIPFGIVDESDV